MKTIKWFGLAVLCLTSTFFSPALAQVLPLDPALTIGKLPNGLTYYIRKNTLQKGRVTLFLVNKAGSILENDDQRGLAHFMEHMNFNGTKHFKANQLVDFLEKAGVRFGADLNAYTSFDETVYQLPLPIENTNMLDSGLLVLHDWANGALVDPKEVEKERGVILEEKRLHGDADQRMNDLYFPLLVNHSRYADRVPIGLDEVIKNAKPETIKAFYKDWYRPDLQAIIIIGDIDVKTVQDKIEKQFADLQNPSPERDRRKYEIPLAGKNQFIALTDNEAQGTIMRVYFKHPHEQLLTLTDYRKYLLRNMLNVLLGEHFKAIAQDNAEHYLSAGANVSPFIGNLDALTATVVTKAGGLENGFRVFWSEVDKIRTEGFNRAEFEAIKQQYLSMITANSKENDKRQSGQYASEYVRHFLDNEASPGGQKETELAKQIIPSIRVKEMNAILNEYLTDSNHDVIITAPESEKSNLPNEQTINSFFKGLKKGLENKYGAVETARAEEDQNSGPRTVIPVPPDRRQVQGQITATKLKPVVVAGGQLTRSAEADKGQNGGNEGALEKTNDKKDTAIAIGPVPKNPQPLKGTVTTEKMGQNVVVKGGLTGASASTGGQSNERDDNFLPSLPRKGKTISTQQIPELGITEYKLGNGVRVILKPTTFKNDEISFTAFRPGGTSLYSDKDFLSASYAAGLVSESGVGNFNAEQLRKKLRGKHLFTLPNISETSEGIFGGCGTSELESALQLVYLYFTQPRQDLTAFKTDINRSKAAIIASANAPQKIFNDTVSAVLSNYHIRRKSPDTTQINQIDPNKAFAIYKERFADAAGFTFVFVGNIDLVKIKPMLEQYLGSLPATGRKEASKDLGIEIPTGTIQKEVRAGIGNKATVQLMISGDYHFSPETNIQLESIKYILELKMLDRLRENDGGVYSPSVNVSFNKSPRSRYSFMIRFGCAPENVDKLINDAWEEIEKLKSNGPSDTDLKKFVAETTVLTKNNLEMNQFWLAYLSNQYQNNLDPKEILDYKTRLEKLNTAQVKDAINSYLDRKNYIRLVLVPQKNG